MSTEPLHKLPPRQASTQRPARAARGEIPLLLVLLAGIGGVVLFVAGLEEGSDPVVVLGAAGFLGALLALSGFVAVAPNDTRVLMVFGRYTGTLDQEGLWFVNPLTAPWRQSVSLRLRNFQSDVVKVNDANGAPIEIAAVVVWRVVDTAKAVFDVRDFEEFVVVQSETAIRHLAAQFPYDTWGEDEVSVVSLRTGTEEVADLLLDELRARLVVAGLDVQEARLTHLAYAPEIARAMLRRQQASAVVAARRTIVAGAVGLVDLALRGIDEQGIVDLDEERKAAMVSNLMVVLAGDRDASPVVNAGSLY